MIRKIVTSHKGRRCKYEGCTKVLSVYNHNTFCHAHLNKMSLAVHFDPSFTKKENS